jgi:hypothetical protein
VRIEGRIEAKDGALRVLPETATVKGVLGGIDAIARPQTAQAEAVIDQDTLNRIVGPIVAKEGFENFRLALHDGNKFVLTGVKVDDDGDRHQVKIDGDLALADKEAVKFTFRKIRYGGITVNFGDLHIKFLQLLGLHLDDVLHIDLPFLKLKEDTLYFQPGKLTDKVQGEIESLTSSEGKLNVKTHVVTPLNSLLPFKTDRFRTDEKSVYITPYTFTTDLAGEVVGFESGNGTARAYVHLTGKDIQHIVHIDEDGVEWRGNEAILDLNKLQDYAQGQIRSITTGEGTITANLDADPAQALKYLPKLPSGLDVNGQRVAISTEALDKNWHGAITGVSVKNGQLNLQVGRPGAKAPGNAIEATTTGAFEISGIRIENARVVMTDATPDTPLDPTQYAKEKLAVLQGKAFIPKAKIEAVLAEKLAGKTPKGATVTYVPGGLAVSAKWKGIPLSGKLAISAAGADGLGVVPEQVHIGPVPVPSWLARPLVSRLAKMPVKDGRVMVDIGQYAGVQLGPITQLDISDKGLAVAIGQR